MSRCPTVCIVFVLLAAGFASFAQNPASQTPRISADSALYEAFFRQAENLRPGRPLQIPRRDGSTAYVIYPRLSDLVDITDSEAQEVVSQARNCVRSVDKFMEEPRKWVMDARLSKIQTGKISSYDLEELDWIDKRHDQIVADSIARLKATLGPQAFEKLDRYLHSSARKATDLMGVMSSTPIPPPK